MAVIGIDLGTSSTKAVLVERDGRILAQADVTYALSTPKPLWSEQDPADWWRGVVGSVKALMAKNPAVKVEGIGIGGQMHGATLLDAEQKVVRPAILWNDGRCQAECDLLHKLVPHIIQATGNRALVGFTAPKLLWVQRNEPAIWAKVKTVLLPKDYVRLLLTGEKFCDMSDGAGMLLVDVANRRWHPDLLKACNIDESFLPKLVEGTAVAGKLTAKAAAELGLPVGIPVVGGAGDQAAGAVGAGCTKPGQTTIALGTSGVVFTTTAAYKPEPDGRLHTFCHAIPNTWHQMGVMLSAAGSLQWYKDTMFPNLSFKDIDALAAKAPIGAEGLTFLPYLTGERTPLCDAQARGAFIGLIRLHQSSHLSRAVLEGVSCGLAASVELIRGAGTTITEATVTGGGAKSAIWMQMLADICNCRIVLRQGADAGPALGGARLALIGACGLDQEKVCAPGPIIASYDPIPTNVAAYKPVLARFNALYGAIKSYCHSV